MTRIVVIEEWGMSRLLHWDRKDLLDLALGCIRWGGGWVILAMAALWWQKGLASIIERPTVLLFAFAVGLVQRLAFALAWNRVTLHSDSVQVTNGGPVREYSRLEIDHLSIKVASQQRMLLRIEWVDTKRRPLLVFGRTDSVEKTIAELQKHYRVVEMG